MRWGLWTIWQPDEARRRAEEVGGVAAAAERRTADGVPVTLSVVIGTRLGWREIGGFVETLLPELAEVGGEAVIASGRPGAPSVPPRVRWLESSIDNVLLLRLRAIRACRGEVIAIGEDHAAPRPGWCAAVVRAHVEHPEAAAVVGCLENATASSIAGRANFLVFAAPFQHPMPTLYPYRPPPISALSFKRAVLFDLPAHDRNPGILEAEVVPRLFGENMMVADDRIVVDHYQDHGMLWSLANAASNTRANYGYAVNGRPARERLGIARWIVANLPSRLWGEASQYPGTMKIGRVDRTAVGVLVGATVWGALRGTFAGPGSAADHVA